jgi:hypothetical protein
MLVKFLNVLSKAAVLRSGRGQVWGLVSDVMTLWNPLKSVELFS